MDTISISINYSNGDNKIFTCNVEKGIDKFIDSINKIKSETNSYLTERINKEIGENG